MLKNKSLDLRKNRILFFIELSCAILLSIGCSLIGMSNLLGLSNDMIPSPIDALGHMSKVIYLSDQLSNGHLPSWFPYWYNGTATTQYYVPLSYYIMVPIYWATHNIMMTYKIFCVSVMTIGSMGVWTFCNKKIGRFCGLVAIIAFSLQPILLTSLYREGVIAQGPIFALMPWYFLLILSCAQKPTKGKFTVNVILITLLILSHAMHAYMVCFSTIIVLLILMIQKKISIRNFVIVGGSIVFSGLLTAFWSLVGVTGLENPGIPYLLPEAAANTTANLQWFLPNGKDAFFYFAIEVSAISFLGIVCYLIATVIKRNNSDMKFYGLSSLLLTIVTMLLSFGMKLPGFRFLPLASGLVPGRILTLTTVTGAISCAYCIYMLWNFPRIKFLLRPVSLAIIVYLCISMNPFVRTYPYTTTESFDTMTKVIKNDAAAFDKGRYNWYGATDSSETLFTYLYDYNISYGWNIEGTPQNQLLYNNLVALPIKEYNYIYKEIAFWNIRYLLIKNEFQDLEVQLKSELGFDRSEGNRDGFTLYVSDQPSSYYLKDDRNALIVSWGMQGFSIHYPNLVQGQSEYLWDYSEEELLKFKTIYIIEPSIDTKTNQNKFEDIVTYLVNAGVTVVIEPAKSNIFDVFGVQAKDELFDDSPIFNPTALCPYNMKKVTIQDNSYLRWVRSLYGLDEVYADFVFEKSNIQNAILGSKKVGNGEVIFVGAHLSQYLDGVYVRNNGLSTLDDIVNSNSEAVETIFNQLFSYYEVNESYLPEVFNKVTEHQWDYDGGSFTYTSEQADEVTISVTYSPRWSATLDGKNISVGQREHLITLILPAGEHKVVLHYGTTVYGKIGYGISIVALIAFVWFVFFWKWNMKLIDKISQGLIIYLQISNSPTIKSPNIIISSLPDANTEEEVSAGDENSYEGTEQTEKIEEQTEELINKNSYNNIDQSSSLVYYHEVFHDNGIKVDIIEINEEAEIAIAENEQGNIAEIRQLKVAETDVVEIAEIELDEIAVSKLAEIDETELTQIAKTEPDEIAEIELAKIAKTEPDEIAEIEPDEIDETELAKIFENEPAKIAVTELTQIAKTELDEIAVTKVAVGEDYEIEDTTTDAIILSGTGLLEEVEEDIIFPINEAVPNGIEDPNEYDKILKRAIYANERNRLKEYYEYLKANISKK